MPVTDEWIGSMWCIHTTEHYSAMERDKVLLLAAVWVALEGIMLSETSQAEKDKYHVISLMCGT